MSAEDYIASKGGEDFYDRIFTRRSEKEDADTILAHMKARENYPYSAERVFNLQPNVSTLIETSYLSVTAVDEEGNLIGIAMFDTHPTGIKSIDEYHENKWEQWLVAARGVKENLNTMNSIWLKYFYFFNIDPVLQPTTMEKILQAAFSSLPLAKNVFFIYRGMTLPEDQEVTGFQYIKNKFREYNLFRKESLAIIKDLPHDSVFWQVTRASVIPPLEIRYAKQEDHDNLAIVFNSQSEVVTDTYGEYFIAELIAAQNETMRALVAQVDAKAVGIMSVTSDIDTKLLWQCFELDPYDNILDGVYMDTVREKRAEIVERRKIEAERLAREEAQKLKEQKIICNLVSQRAMLQQYLVTKKDEIEEEFTKINDGTERLFFKRPDAEALIEKWLEGYELQQPSDYFLEKQTTDTDVFCNILTEAEFFLDTLEIFGLPKGYLGGNGHFKTWYKNKEEEMKKFAKGRKPGAQQRGQAPKRGARAAAAVEEVKVEKMPEYFDLEPLQTAINAFLDAGADNRTAIRQQLEESISRLEKAFKNEQGEFDKDNFEVNTTNMALHLNNAGFHFEEPVDKIIGPALRCFGMLKTEDYTKLVEPPQPAEESKAAPKGGARGRLRAAQEKETAVPSSVTVDCGVLVEFQKDADLKYIAEEVTFMKTSFDQVMRAIDLIKDYDHTLFKLGELKGDELEKDVLFEEQEDDPEAAQDEGEESADEQPDPSASKKSGVALPRSDSRTSKADSQAASGDDSRASPRNMEVYEEEVDDYKQAVMDLDDLELIPDPPERAKNAFCMTLYCIEDAFDSQGVEFLEAAFEQFPERDYMVVTQPHTIQESTILRYFTPIQKKPNNTFQHTLYIMHRDFLQFKYLTTRRSNFDDIEAIGDLINVLDDPNATKEAFTKAIDDDSSTSVAFTVEIQGMPIGMYLLSRDVNLQYYRSHFDIEEMLLIGEYDRGVHTRLQIALLNPIFLQAQRFVITDVLRYMNKEVLYFETHNLTVIPDVFFDLHHVKSRRFPHFLKRKWDHERYVANEIDGEANQDGNERDFLDEEESKFALSLISKRLLSENKVVVNTRIVVVGASDTGISFIESLLSFRSLHFTNIYLLAPGGLPYHLIDEEAQNYRANSTNYSQDQIIKLMLETRVKVIDGRMLDLDRDEKHIWLHDDSQLKYDILILAMGLQDATLQKFGYVSRGLAPIPVTKNYADGVLSIDDPYLTHQMNIGGPLWNLLIHKKHPATCLLYGHTLHLLTFAQGLLERGINANQIKVALQKPVFEVDESVDPLFGGDEEIMSNHVYLENDDIVEEKVKEMFEELGIEIYSDANLINIVLDEKDQLSQVELTVEGEQVFLNCKILITSGNVSVDDDNFCAIHKNGLVYNGRLIVDNKFRTTDASIYAAGSLCEISHQYKSLSNGHCMRMDRNNGKEIGIALAKSVMSTSDDLHNEGLVEYEESFPIFKDPRGKGGILPNKYFYYYIEMPKYALPKLFKDKVSNRPDIVSNTDSHYIKFSFNNYGLVHSVTYLAQEEVQVQSLWSFVGVSETYLNKLSSRFDAGIIPDIAEFLSENWAICLYHDWFKGFCIDLNQGVKEQIGAIMESVAKLTEDGMELSRDHVDEILTKLPPDVRSLIEDRLLAYLRQNMNHLPMYYIPGAEFP